LVVFFEQNKNRIDKIIKLKIVSSNCQIGPDYTPGVYFGRMGSAIFDNFIQKFVAESATEVVVENV